MSTDQASAVVFAAERERTRLGRQPRETPSAAARVPKFSRGTGERARAGEMMHVERHAGLAWCGARIVQVTCPADLVPVGQRCGSHGCASQWPDAVPLDDPMPLPEPAPAPERHCRLCGKPARLVAGKKSAIGWGHSDGVLHNHDALPCRGHLSCPLCTEAPR